MKLDTTSREFEWLEHTRYDNQMDTQTRLASQSSIVGGYEDSWDRAGSSALWIGADHHLNREEVAQFIKHLQAWVDTGSMKI